MRRLLLLRHAKSSWDTPGLADLDRPLAPRGRRTAPLVAQLMAKRRWVPDLVLCSQAERVRETWQLMAPLLGEEIASQDAAHDLSRRAEPAPDDAAPVARRGEDAPADRSQSRPRVARHEPLRRRLEEGAREDERQVPDRGAGRDRLRCRALVGALPPAPAGWRRSFGRRISTERGGAAQSDVGRLAVIKLLVMLAVAYAGIVALLYFGQRSLIFRGAHMQSQPLDHPRAPERLELADRRRRRPARHAVSRSGRAAPTW